MADEQKQDSGFFSRKLILTALAQIIGLAMQVMSNYQGNQWVQIALVACGSALQVLTILGYYKANVTQKVGLASAISAIATAAASEVAPKDPLAPPSPKP